MRNPSARGWFFCLFLAAWLTPCATLYGQPKESDYLLGQGLHAYHAGRFAAAHEKLTAAIDAGSQDPRAYYFRGLCASKLGRAAEAEADFLAGSNLEINFAGRKGEIGQSLSRVQGSIRLTLEGYRSQARAAMLEKQGPNQQPQIASGHAFGDKPAVAAPQGVAPQAGNVKKWADAPVAAPSSRKRVSPERAEAIHAPTLSQTSPAIIESSSPAVVVKAAPRVFVAAKTAQVDNKPEAVPAPKVQQPAPAPKIPFDFGQALGGLTGGELPGNMAYLRISKRYLDQLMGEEFHQLSPSSDNILGTIYQGTSDTRGRTRLVFIPNDRQAIVEMHFQGLTNFSTSGTIRSVQLHSTGATWFDSKKVLTIDGSGGHLTPACTKANTCYVTDGLCTCLRGLRRCIALKVTGRREARSHGQASAVISHNSERDIGRGFDAEMEKELASATKWVMDRVRELPADHPLVAHGIHCHTSDDAIFIVLLGPGADEQKFVTAPTLNKTGPDVELHVHSSLAAKAIADPKLLAMLESAAGSLAATPGSESPKEAPPANAAPQYDIYWSPDRSWLTLVWNAAIRTTGK